MGCPPAMPGMTRTSGCWRRTSAPLGFVPYLDPAVQGPIITTFRYPAGARFTFQQMYEYIKARGYVLYPGKVMEAETFRVGNIGEIYPEDIPKLSAILADFLKEVAA